MPSPLPRPLAQQRRAIEAPLGPVLVVAGPGAGKTFCLIGRIGHLILERKLRPERILACTFTNKAAEEIALRLKESLGERARLVHRGTIHSLCAGLLREHAEAAGVERGFGIADEEYQRIVLRRLRVGLQRVGELLKLFSRRRLAGYQLAEADERRFQEYLGALRRRKMLDFDDLVALAGSLLASRPDVADRIAARWDYVLVDEFQDVNQAQYAILRRLAQPHGNLFAVGDEEQSIFSWAGADPRVLKRFQEETLAQPIVLDKNHRCSRPIFETARRLLRVNPSLFDKALSAERRSDYQVTALAFEDESDEAAWLLEDLRADRERTGLSWGEYAVLYRVHRMGDRLESRLVKSGVPCRLARGRALGEDEVIGWVAASLELMRRPGDPAVVEKLATRVLGEETMELVRGATAGAEDFIASLREFAGGRPAEPLTKLIWRFVFHVENLAALARAHAALEPLVMDVLSQRVGRFTNRLEESHEQLSDPAQAPEALRLANKLRAARDSGARLVVEPMDGLEVGIKGLLHAAGLKVVAYRDEAPAPRLDDVPLGPSDAGPLGLAVTAFKALQLLHAARLGDLFARYVAFDVETSSFDQSLCEVVEIAAARVVGGRVTARFHELVRPERGIRAEAAGVHGITDDEVRDAAPFAEVWRRFRDFVGADTLVAHNGQRFDVPVLRRLAEPLGGAEWLTCFDTLPLARALVDGRARLGVLAERFGIEAGRSHRADADVETLARVFGELEKLRQVRARKSVLVSALDYLGLALALDPLGGASEEQGVLLELSRASTLGRYSDALDFYEAERERRAAAPHLESVIERLGGRNLMDRLRAERRPEERYPAAVARLRLLMEGLDDRPLEEAMEAFLERVALSSSAGPETDPHRVSLLTLHSTKGLEFDRVYIIGVEDEQLPGLRPDDEDPDAKLQEARRLLYVGMTRARERLVLTRATQRFGRPTGGARFLDEMGVEARSVGSPA